jgi:hypothetical protein
MASWELWVALSWDLSLKILPKIERRVVTAHNQALADMATAAPASLGRTEQV